MVTFKHSEQDARLRYNYEEKNKAVMFYAYSSIRQSLRSVNTDGTYTLTIPEMKAKVDTFIAAYGHCNYSRNLQAYITEALETAPDKALYNRDGTKKNSIIMNGKTYAVVFSPMTYENDRLSIPAYQSVTYTDVVTGKKWHWSASAYVRRKSEDDFTGRIYRTTTLNGVVYSKSDYRFSRIMDVMHEVYSDPSQVVRSFIAYTETLTKGLNQE